MKKKGVEQIRGADFFMRLCKQAERKNVAIGLYGGRSDALFALKNKIRSKFPYIRITFDSSPPFRELTIKEKEDYIKKIRESNCQILFVGLGCPKQEKWMAEYKSELSCVMVGVGAAFDFLSGRKKYAPHWIQRIGMEWLFRLVHDPCRLWKRYMKHNPRFVYYAGKQIIQHFFLQHRRK